MRVTAGAESRTLRSTDWSRLCIGMLLLELHGNYIPKLTKTPYRIVELLSDVRRLEAAGFRLYASEAVCARCHGQAELAFINVSWARQLAEMGPREYLRHGRA